MANFNPGPYQLHVETNDWEFKDGVSLNGGCQIRVWGLDKDSFPFLLRIEDYPCKLTVELPERGSLGFIRWDTELASNFHYAIKRRLESQDDLLQYSPGDFSFKRKLYYYQGSRRFPFIELKFLTKASMDKIIRVCNYPMTIRDVGEIRVKTQELDIPPIRKLLTDLSVSHTEWITCLGYHVEPGQRISTLEREFIVPHRSIQKTDPELCKEWVTNPLVVAFDIETYSHRHNAMPDRWNHQCNAYLMSLVFKRYGDEGSKRDRYVITLCDHAEIPPDDEYADCKIIPVRTELEMVEVMAKLFEYHNPDVISGYNLTYDFTYLGARLARLGHKWPCLGRLKGERVYLSDNGWSSSAYGKMDIVKAYTPGRLTIDMYVAIKKNGFKFLYYNLGFVAQELIGRTKLPVTPKDMFIAYEKSMKARAWKQQVDRYIEYNIQQLCQTMTPIEAANHESIQQLHRLFVENRAEHYDGGMKAMLEVIRYVIQDSDLVPDLMEKTAVWVDVKETSKAVGVSILDVLNCGQQKRCLYLLYDHAHGEGVVIDTRSGDDMSYVGGAVQEPLRGIYDLVLIFDFNSLYPTIIIEHNVCYTTLVPPHLMDSTPDELCHVIYVECRDDEFISVVELDNDDFGETKKKKPKKEDIKTRTVKVMFMKEPRGLLPTIVGGLITRRKEVRAQGYKFADAGDTMKALVYDKRQNALKVCANSFFGFTGVHVNGRKPLLEAAMSITAWGRKMITYVIEWLKREWNATIIYGDTDSVMITLPFITHPRDCKYWGEFLSKKLSALFGGGVKMENENNVRILCIEPKKYGYLYIDPKSPNGDFIMKKNELHIQYKGVMAARRDNCKWCNSLYKRVFLMCISRAQYPDVMDVIIDAIYEFVIKKTVGLEEVESVKSYKGNYKNPNYPMNLLARNMNAAGKQVQAGDRIGYIVYKKPGEKYLGNRMITIDMLREGQAEGMDYEVDFLYYVEKMLQTHIDQLINVSYHNIIDQYLANFELKLRTVQKKKYGTFTLKDPNAFLPSKSRSKPLNFKSPVKMIVGMINAGLDILELKSVVRQYVPCVQVVAYQSDVLERMLASSKLL